eukprot:TRINITY_DN70052_c0_g1_i1.p2 TRINITY_DN70052_c0_g1~~TRINITY_DN70052_c0_g1_i1.p2  ORF type:complete len:210 (+),score=66.49 TRINITY_DN70052_c0_g1_i1:82-630(+)
MPAVAVVLAEDNYEDLELHYPRLRLIEAGFEVKVVGPKRDTTYKSKFGYWARSTHTWPPASGRADESQGQVDPSSVRILIVPGGFAPDRLRRYPECNSFIAACYHNGSVVGHICHGAHSLVSARILQGVRTTSFPAIKDDVTNAGAEWVDESCVVDKRIVGAQVPEDLPAFMRAVLELAGPP